MDEIYILISKYLSGEGTPDEALSVERWINNSEKNREEFNRLFSIMQASPTQAQNYVPPDINEEWKKLQTKISPQVKPPFKKYFFYGFVGCVVITLCIFLNNTKHLKQPIDNSKESKNFIITHDTAIAAVNIYPDSKSSVTVTKSNNSEPEYYKIKGSAFFSINDSVNTKQKYIAGNIIVEPQSKASFFINYDSVNSFAEIEVNSGNLLVERNNDKWNLPANEAIRFHNDSVIKSSTNINRFSFATRIFDFRNISLPEAFQAIEKAYHIKITIRGSELYNCRLTAYFDNKSLQEVIDIMSFTLNFKYAFAKSNKEIFVSGKGCL